jgi:hypothetical protein
MKDGGELNSRELLAMAASWRLASALERPRPEWKVEIARTRRRSERS